MSPTHEAKTILSMSSLPDGTNLTLFYRNLSPGELGILLADVIRHFESMQKQEVRDEVVEWIERELESPTTEIERVGVV